MRAPPLLALLALLAAGCPRGPTCDDLDGDLYCSLAEGGADCDDGDAGVHPGAQERCGDAVDQDCSGAVDDVDLDGDGHIDGACGGDDCDALAAGVHPSADEGCGDELDSDCSGDPDDADLDGDGHIDIACGGDDCDDGEQYVNPDRLERCDGLDNDCDGALDEGELDADGDGYLACDDDCDDGDAAVHPGASEGSDGVDADCDDLVCGGTSGRGQATCLLDWLARYDDPTGCEVDTRAMDAGQPAVALAVERALSVASAGDAPSDADACTEAAASVEASLSAAGLAGLIEAVCIEGTDGEHLLVLRERGDAVRGGFAVVRLSGWEPRRLADGTAQHLVIGVPQRDHASAPACGDADLYTFHMGLREMVESRIPRALIVNGFPRGAINPTGTGAESSLRDALPGLLEARGVDDEDRPNRSTVAANGAAVFYAVANPLEGSSVRDVVLAVDPAGSGQPRCVFGHPDYIGPDGQPCDVADDSSPYLDDIRALHATDDWLVLVDGGSQPTVFALELSSSGSARALALVSALDELPSDRPFCEPGPSAMSLEGDEGTLFLIDEGGTSGCGDGGVKLVRLAVYPGIGGVGELETVAVGLQGAAAITADSQGNLVLGIDSAGAQDLVAWPLAGSGDPDEQTLLLGDDCRIVDSRFGVDHSVEDLVALSFTPAGLLLAADADGHELFGALLERGVDGGVAGIARLAETDLADADDPPELRAITAASDEQAWLLVEPDDGGRYELVPLEVYSRGDIVQEGNLEERGRLTPYHQTLEAMARLEDVLHLQFHGYDEDDPDHAALEIPGLQPVPYHWAALLSPGLPWGEQTEGFHRAVAAFQEAFDASGSELVYPYPACVTHHDLGARTNRQGQLLNYGELQDGLDGLARHYGDHASDAPGDQLLHIEWPLGLREQLYDGDSQASIYLRQAIEGLVDTDASDWTCPFEPDAGLPALPEGCSEGD